VEFGSDWGLDRCWCLADEASKGGSRGGADIADIPNRCLG